MTEDAPLPDPTGLPGVPHPRETARLFGQAAAEAEFLEAFAAGRMHSGWLLTGPRGIGKATLAWRIAGFLLTAPPDAAADGLFGAPPPPATLDPVAGEALHRLRQGLHPGLHVVRRGPNDKGDRISADIRATEVRKLKSFFHLAATDGGRRVVIVDAADEMNVTAANALLKELEEPPARTTLLLVCHQPARLLPTIRSRCRALRLAPLGTADLAAALDQAGIDSAETAAIAALSGGSVGEAVRLIRMDGLRIYADLVGLFDGTGRIDRSRALALAESAAGPKNADRFDLLLDLFDRFLARTARAGLIGPPADQGAPGEARLLARLCPDDRAARAWADLAQRLSDRARHGQAVNLDPASVILDMVFRTEEVARATLPA